MYQHKYFTAPTFTDYIAFKSMQSTTLVNVFFLAFKVAKLDLLLVLKEYF